MVQCPQFSNSGRKREQCVAIFEAAFVLYPLVDTVSQCCWDLGECRKVWRIKRPCAYIVLKFAELFPHEKVTLPGNLHIRRTYGHLEKAPTIDVKMTFWYDYVIKAPENRTSGIVSVKKRGE